MLIAISNGVKVIVTIDDSTEKTYFLERRSNCNSEWLVYTDDGFVSRDESPVLKEVSAGDLLDTVSNDGLYQYRYYDSSLVTVSDSDYVYSMWVRCGTVGKIGYTFKNYVVPEGHWGTCITPDDLRYTYLWGTDFKATNGESFTDEQIEFFIESSVKDIERELDITIEKQRIRFNPEDRNLKKGIDYDTEEAVYDFKYERIAKYGMIRTRQRPVIRVTELNLLSRLQSVMNLLPFTIIDKQKGVLKFTKRPIKPTETLDGIQTSIGMYGRSTYNPHLFYSIDYDAGYETSDDVPADLREIVAKKAAIQLLNVIGDGLMSGFSSSSLSMDGMSESFSSTQSATSAYFGARIKEYKDDIDLYIKENKRKFSNLPMGNL